MKVLSILATLFILVACNPSIQVEKIASLEVIPTSIDSKFYSPQPVFPDSPIIDETQTKLPDFINICLDIDGLKIYSGPGTQFELLDQIIKDECVDILAISPDKRWLKIDRGWVSANFLENNPQIERLQILDENFSGQSTLISNSPPSKTMHPTNTVTSLPTSTMLVKPTATTTDTPQPQLPPNSIIWNEAIDHIGERNSVCGPILGASYLSSTNGQPTFLDMGEKYPDPNRVTIIIWGSNRSKFSSEPESYYFGKNICVYGLIEYYKGIAEVEVTDPSQITIQ